MCDSSLPRQRLSFSTFLKELFLGFVTEYETPKIVTIHSYSITTLLRILQTMLLFYSILYLFIYEKGYQKQDSAIISSITLKVKGIGQINTMSNETYVIDGTDYIVPPSENNAIFIMTNFIQTNQVRSRCPENPTVSEAKCKSQNDCLNKSYLPNINGRWTGRCLLPSGNGIFSEANVTTNETYGICEIQGWCPVEDDLQETTQVHDVLNFTIFIKNFIEFPSFNVKHKNIIDNLKPCVYDPVTDKDCPIFRLDYILKQAEKNSKERELMLKLGGVIRVKVDWYCNLDRGIKLCKPLYSFARLDTPSYEEKFSVGFNFRFASHWKQNRRHLRALTKAYGLRFIICVSGKAGKFDFITLTLNTGSLVGIFGLATFFCDIILLNLTRRASIYRNYVFQRVDLKSTANTVSQMVQERAADFSIVYENFNADQQTVLTPRWTTDPIARRYDKQRTTHSYEMTSPDRSPKTQPSLGLTNVIN